MSTQVKKKQTPKGGRLGWTPLKQVKPVKLTPDSLTGKKVSGGHATNEVSSSFANSFLIP
jgi:hypothetical protein